MIHPSEKISQKEAVLPYTSFIESFEAYTVNLGEVDSVRWHWSLKKLTQYSMKLTIFWRQGYKLGLKLQLVAFFSCFTMLQLVRSCLNPCLRLYLLENVIDICRLNFKICFSTCQSQPYSDWHQKKSHSKILDNLIRFFK